MNIKQADLILKKINRLYETMTLDDQVDVFEQDLMLSYIRQLYEAFSPEESKKGEAKIEVPPVPKIPDPKPKAEKKPVAKPKIEIEKSSPPAEEAPKPVYEESKPSDPIAEKQAASEPKTETSKPQQPKPAPPKSSAPKTSVPTGTGNLSKEDYDALFDHKEAKELSEKLSQMPIKDLTKAMGLNEKIFTINELFGEDSKAFDVAIKTLNTFHSFDQAKAYLSDNIAGQYGWTEKSRKKKAINFIKLIRRRYN